MMGEWTKAVAALPAGATEAVDCDAEPERADAQSVQGFPTIRLVLADGSVRDFDRPRTSEELIAFFYE